MNTEDTKPNATRAGTIELGLELKDLSAVLAGLEQIKIAALEAAAAVASIGAAMPKVDASLPAYDPAIGAKRAYFPVEAR